MLMSRDELSREIRHIAEDQAKSLRVPLSPEAINHLATVPSDFIDGASQIDVIPSIRDILHQAKMYNSGTVNEELVKHIMTNSPRRYLWFS